MERRRDNADDRRRRGNTLLHLDKNGHPTSVAGLTLETGNAVAIRVHSNGSGFYVAMIDEEPGGAEPVLWSIDAQGVAQQAGIYSKPSPIDWIGPYGDSVIDSDGVLYEIDANYTSGEYVVIRRPLAPQGATVFYSLSQTPSANSDSYVQLGYTSTLISTP